MQTLFEYLFLFCLCGSVGWVLEFFYRAVRHGKIVNPGFLVGCCLPIYGVGGCILYFLCGLRLRFLPNEVFRTVFILLIAAVVMTGIEFLGGYISLRVYRVRLWDYSHEWGNVMGIICPKFSVIWGAISALYYFLVFPLAHRLARFVAATPAALFLLGLYLGVFFVDLVHSLHLLQRIKAYATEMRIAVQFDQLKRNAREYFADVSGEKRPRRFAPTRILERYMADRAEYREEIRRKWGKNA